jgi:predicted DsbA family dithiol-disulfide isomerase
MKIEIWSDIVCPFCFIGKHRLEKAMEKFPELKFEVIWKSFQLNPNQVSDVSKNNIDYLTEVKGWSKQQAISATERVCEMGKNCDIHFDMEKSKVANSLNAHKLLHLAKKKNVQNEMKEKLFQAHFTDGKNIDDVEMIIEISESLGISREECMHAFNDSEILKEIHTDFSEAQAIGIRGVPYFVFDRKYAVSGAQEEAVIENVIQEILKERV